MATSKCKAYHSIGPEINPAVQEILKSLTLWQQLNLANAGQSTVQPRSYDKGGYSVVISNGTLCHANNEMGIVMMKTGTQFQIAIANNNDCGELNAHVDINFPNT